MNKWVDPREQKFHVIKSWCEFYEPVNLNEKWFELRRNDRDYNVGDVLILREWDHVAHEFTGRWCCRIVTYLLRSASGLAGHAPQNGLELGYVIMSLGPVSGHLTREAERCLKQQKIPSI